MLKNISDSDKMMYLGILMKVTGLTLNDLEKISNNELILDTSKTPFDIRNYILEDSEAKITFIRKMINSGIALNEIASFLNLSLIELQGNIDNFYYYINTVDFKLRSNSIFRNRMVDFLNTKGLGSSAISDILDVSYSTIRSYLRS